MNERPIVFSAPMVRAILAGTKTQTRRIIKLPHENRLGQWEPTTFGGPEGGMTKAGETIPLQRGIWHTRTGDHLGCPYGQPGDRLWVRETWMYGQGSTPIFRAGVLVTPKDQAWRSPIHMPRWASRITLEITSVRVERLHDISEADAISEGIESAYDSWRDYRTNPAVNFPCADSPISSYQTLWESINGAGSWDANSWVWVVEFRRVEGGAA